MVHSWIVNSCDPEIADSVTYYSTAHEVWEDLYEPFSEGNATRIFEIQRDIASLRQEQLSVSAYYTKLKSLWDELATHSDIAQVDRQKLMQFLMGLNETYSAIRGQILLMNPLPSIRQAYSSISQEEKQRLLKFSTYEHRFKQQRGRHGCTQQTDSFSNRKNRTNSVSWVSRFSRSNIISGARTCRTSRRRSASIWL